jgi:hypothetical protein
VQHVDGYWKARNSGAVGGVLQGRYLDADKKLVLGMLFKASFAPKTRIGDLAFGVGPSIGSRYKFLATGTFIGLMAYRKARS